LVFSRIIGITLVPKKRAFDLQEKGNVTEVEPFVVENVECYRTAARLNWITRNWSISTFYLGYGDKDVPDSDIFPDRFLAYVAERAGT
jgi:hypothetical protein